MIALESDGQDEAWTACVRLEVSEEGADVLLRVLRDALFAGVQPKTIIEDLLEVVEEELWDLRETERAFARKGSASGEDLP